MSNLTFNVCKRENNENKVNLRRVGLDSRYYLW